MAVTARKVTDRSGKHHEADEAAPARSTAEELARLVDLKDKGAISEDEFEQAKKHVLA
jgi:ribosome-binding protein aMBF1 (putative translation factor)